MYLFRKRYRDTPIMERINENRSGWRSVSTLLKYTLNILQNSRSRWKMVNECHKWAHVCSTNHLNVGSQKIVEGSCKLDWLHECLS